MFLKRNQLYYLFFTECNKEPIGEYMSVTVIVAVRVGVQIPVVSLSNDVLPFVSEFLISLNDKNNDSWEAYF
jgi:hypothetical protein